MRRLFLIVMFLMLAGAAAAGQNSGMIDIRKTSTAMLGYIASFGIAETDIERVTTIQIKEGGKRGGGPGQQPGILAAFEELPRFCCRRSRRGLPHRQWL